MTHRHRETARRRLRNRTTVGVMLKTNLGPNREARIRHFTCAPNYGPNYLKRHVVPVCSVWFTRLGRGANARRINFARTSVSKKGSFMPVESLDKYVFRIANPRVRGSPNKSHQRNAPAVYGLPGNNK
jgi:hypothetical protein